MLDKIKEINRGLDRRFPTGHTPFQIMTRLLDEGGELAQQMNLFEDSASVRSTASRTVLSWLRR